jgi:enediyne biosynthesis protein E4
LPWEISTTTRADLVACALDSPAALLLNDSESGRFLSLEVIDTRGRPAPGARVRGLAGGRWHAGALVSGGSYLAASQPRLFFGLGTAPAVDRIEVTWPWGVTEVWQEPGLAPRSALVIRQGTGRPGG